MQRISFLMCVREGQQQEYIRRHDNVWPDVMEEHARAGITKMSIFMHGRDLFLYMEVDDYAKAVEILTKSPAALRWEEYMAPLMEALDDKDYDPNNAFPGSLPEVFYWESAGSRSASGSAATSRHNTPQPSPAKP